METSAALLAVQVPHDVHAVHANLSEAQRHGGDAQPAVQRIDRAVRAHGIKDHHKSCVQKQMVCHLTVHTGS